MVVVGPALTKSAPSNVAIHVLAREKHCTWPSFRHTHTKTKGFLYKQGL